MLELKRKENKGNGKVDERKIKEIGEKKRIEILDWKKKKIKIEGGNEWEKIGKKRKIM